MYKLPCSNKIFSTVRESYFEKNRKKDRLPMHLGYTLENDVHVVFADFDNVANLKKFIARIETEVEGVHFITPSGNGYKIAFKVRSSRMNWSDRVRFLNDVLPKWCVKYLDASRAACERAYVTFEQMTQINNATVSYTYKPSVGCTKRPNFKYKTSVVPMELRRDYPEMIKLLEILTNLPKLQQGYDLPTTTLGEQCGVSPNTISMWLKTLCENGVIEKISNSYMPGKFAKKFKAISTILVSWLSNLNDKEKMSVELPTFFTKGNFYYTILQILHMFKNKESFLDWINTVVGTTYERYKLATRMWNCYEKKCNS